MSNAKHQQKYCEVTLEYQFWPRGKSVYKPEIISKVIENKICYNLYRYSIRYK